MGGSTRAELPRLRRHVAELAARNGVVLEVGSTRRARAFRAVPSRGVPARIRVPEIRGQVTYFTALHELGHLLSPGNRSLRQLEAEADAWRFALAQSLVPPTPATASRLHAYLASYVRRAEQRRRRGDRVRAVVPGPQSPYWSTLALLERLAAGRGDVSPAG